MPEEQPSRPEQSQYAGGQSQHAGRPSHRPQFPHPRRWILNLPIAGAYIALTAVLVSFETDTAYWLSLVLVAATCVATFLLIFVVMVQQASRDQRHGRQFGLSTLLLLIAIASLYLGVLRWFFVASPAPPQNGAGQWLRLVAYSFYFLLFSIPYLLLLGEPLMWAAVWVVWLPPVQRMLSVIRKRSRPKSVSDH